MADMLVKLYDIPDKRDIEKQLKKEGIVLKRAMTIDKGVILDYIRTEFNDICPTWFYECEKALLREPVSCFIAVKDARVVGFCCYDTTAKAFIGPIGVSEDYRKRGIAGVLLVKTMEAMLFEGYGYAIIGWVSSVEYYHRAVGAIEIPESDPGIYQRMVANT